MANDPYTCTRIITDYRAVAHIVEGICILGMIIFQCFVIGLYLVDVLYIIAGGYELLKGLLLLHGILKDNRRNVVIYLVLNLIGLIIRKGLIIFVFVMIGNLFGLIILLLILFAALYFSYEWFMLYHVHKFYKNMDNRGNVDGLRCEEVQILVDPPEMPLTL